jgi:uncharacterized membrane protein YhaH (DUF805 family)
VRQLGWVLSICGFVLVCVAAAHRAQLAMGGPPAYTQGPLLAVEVGLLFLSLFVLVVLAPAGAIVLAVKRRWRDLGVLAIHAVLAILFVAAAVTLDAPTLLFAT